MPNQFFSPEGDLEEYFVTDYWLIDQYIGDTLWVWGLNSDAQLGINATTYRSTPVTTFAGGTNWKQVSGGTFHTGAIKTDGTLWIWGRGGSGQLGNAVTTNRSTPVTTFAGGTNWRYVSLGNDCSAAIKTDGTLWTWGSNSLMHLGINVTGNRSTPVTTFAGGTNWKQVSMSAGGAAIKTDGTLWTWGRGSSGELGNAATTNRSTPVTTFAGGTNWKQVSCGNAHTAAIKTDGTLWTWGAGTDGELGNADTTDRSTPVTTFAGGTGWKQVSASNSTDPQTGAIKTDGTLWMWGDNGTGGYLGINDTTNTLRSTPVTTFAGGTNWKQVSTSGLSAIKTNGTLWVWSGQNGTNSSVARFTPVTTFLGGNDWKQVTYTAAITAGTSADLPFS
jgi:alpha-tubulin suppressor-like RCC1 family protein